jgi:hypothetical protein
VEQTTGYKVVIDTIEGISSDAQMISARPELPVHSIRVNNTFASAALVKVVVSVRWSQFQCSIAAFYSRRVSLPVQFWRACGWLRLSAWRRR